MNIQKKFNYNCEKCNGHLQIRDGKFGKFWGCSNWREENGCNFIKKYVKDDFKYVYKKENVTEKDITNWGENQSCECGGKFILKSQFLGCSNFPYCLEKRDIWLFGKTSKTKCNH